MSNPTPEMIEAYFQELSHVNESQERTWFSAGVAAYAYLMSSTSDDWKQQHGFMEEANND